MTVDVFTNVPDLCKCICSVSSFLFPPNICLNCHELRGEWISFPCLVCFWLFFLVPELFLFCKCWYHVIWLVNIHKEKGYFLSTSSLWIIPFALKKTTLFISWDVYVDWFLWSEISISLAFIWLNFYLSLVFNIPKILFFF